MMLKKPLGFDEAPENKRKEFPEMPKLPRGNYVVRIQGTEDEIDTTYNYQQIKFAFDIDEGENKGFYALKFEHESKNPYDDKPVRWKGNIRLKIPTDAKPDETEEQKSMRIRAVNNFRRAIEYFEDANPGFHFDWDDPRGSRQFLSLIIGVKFEPVAMIKNNGEKTEWQRPKWFESVKTIREGKSKQIELYIPNDIRSAWLDEPLKYNPETKEGFREIPDDELPF